MKCCNYCFPVLLTLALSLRLSGYDNLDYGVPTTNGVVVIDREGYAVGYSAEYRQPLWVSYRLTRDELFSGDGRSIRSNDFREDTSLVEADRSTLADYRGSGYDRGHLAPAADMAWSDKAMSESFLLSNMSPQSPAFNRGVWKDLESWVRRLAQSETSVVVISGCVFMRNANPKTIGKNDVRIPEAYFKVVLDETPPMRIHSFMIPNVGSEKSFADYSMPKKAVEAWTGMRFFERLPRSDEMDEIVSGR